MQLAHIIRFITLAVFAMRCLVPVGFMLDTSKGPNSSMFGLEIVICTGHVPAPHDDQSIPTSPKPAKQAAASDLCPYAGHGTTADLASVPDGLASTVRYAEVIYGLEAQIFAATPKPKPITARGPPSIA